MGPRAPVVALWVFRPFSQSPALPQVGQLLGTVAMGIAPPLTSQPGLEAEAEAGPQDEVLGKEGGPQQELQSGAQEVGHCQASLAQERPGQEERRP